MRIEFTERGLVTILTLAACFTLLMCGKDHIVGYSLMVVVGGYYGIELGPVARFKKWRKGDK